MCVKRSIWFGLVKMMGCTVPVGLGVGLIGSWVTWTLGGAAGLTGQLLAALIALTGVTACGIAVLRSARRGPGPAAFTFVIASLVTGVAALVAGVIVGAAVPGLFVPLLIWVAVFCSAMLLAQSLWIARGLNRSTLKDFQEQELPSLDAEQTV